MRHSGFFLLIMTVLLLSGCNPTKHIPDNQYLLNKTAIHIDNTDISKSDLQEYLRQTPNSTVLGLFKMQLGIYNLSGKDSTSRLNRQLKKIGEAPVIYDEHLTDISAQQLQNVLVNKGYVNAKVETKVKLKHKKADVEYMIKANKPYLLGNYNVDIKNELLKEVATDTAKTLIHPNMLFDVDVLDAERQRVTTALRQQGYYNFSKDLLVFSADSTLRTHKINLEMNMRSNFKVDSDSVSKIIFRKFNIRKVFYFTNTDADQLVNRSDLYDTISFRDFHLIEGKEKFISLDALVHNTYINPNTAYSDMDVEKTYSALNSLEPVKYVNITFRQVNNDQLDCYIILVPAKTISVSTELEGTYTDGYWGGAAKINGVNKNTFKGAESLSTQARLAYEWQEGIWARELGAQVGLKFPKFLFPVGSYDFKRNFHANTEFTSNISFQDRPYEFTATTVSSGVSYLWNQTKFKHSFELFNLSYMDFHVTQSFWDTYLATGEYNKYNYESRFILRMSYSGSYTTFNPNRPLRDYSTYRYSLESAGNSLYALNKILGSARSNEGNYELFGIRYSQYMRGEYNSTHYQIFNKNNRFVYHLGLGVGIPYGNADVIPYERRFYAGGANSVRGWSESTLGPGTYIRNPNVLSRDYNQVGDIKLDMNMEYRAKMFWLLEGALFMDAGNVWTIKDYSEQPGGQFKLDTFAEQIALAYGAGLRMDFSFFLLRFDAGIKLYDPSLSRTQRWRINTNWSEFKQDVAFHIAIGYPF